MVLHGKKGCDVLLQGHHLEELSPKSHEQRAELSQVHIYLFCQLIRGFSFLLKYKDNPPEGSSEHKRHQQL